MENSVLTELKRSSWTQAGANLLFSAATERPDIERLLVSRFSGPPGIHEGLLKKSKIPASLKWRVWLADDFRCRHCGVREGLTCDHVVAESAGGPTVFENLQTLCGSCNSRKGVS